MAGRIFSALLAYVSGDGSHGNNLTQFVGSSSKRMRVGDYRVIFDETPETLTVLKIEARGGIYD